MKRLQGYEWYYRLPYLKYTRHSVTESGNIRFICQHIFTGQKYSHYLNDEEKNKFLNGSLLNNQKMIILWGVELLWLK